MKDNLRILRVSLSWWRLNVASLNSFLGIVIVTGRKIDLYTFLDEVSLNETIYKNFSFLNRNLKHFTALVILPETTVPNVRSESPALFQWIFVVVRSTVVSKYPN